MSKIINRRKFLGDTAFSAAGIMLGSKMLGSNLDELYQSINCLNAEKDQCFCNL